MVPEKVQRPGGRPGMAKRDGRGRGGGQDMQGLYGLLFLGKDLITMGKTEEQGGIVQG